VARPRVALLSDNQWSFAKRPPRATERPAVRCRASFRTCSTGRLRRHEDHGTAAASGSETKEVAGVTRATSRSTTGDDRGRQVPARADRQVTAAIHRPRLEGARARRSSAHKAWDKHERRGAREAPTRMAGELLQLYAQSGRRTPAVVAYDVDLRMGFNSSKRLLVNARPMITHGDRGSDGRPRESQDTDG